MNRTRRLSPREIARAARERSAQMRSSHPDAVPCVIEEKVGDGRYKVKRDSWPFSILVPVTPASADIRTPIRWMLCFEDGNRQLPFVHWPERPSKFLDPGSIPDEITGWASYRSDFGGDNAAGVSGVDLVSEHAVADTRTPLLVRYDGANVWTLWAADGNSRLTGPGELDEGIPGQPYEMIVTGTFAILCYEDGQQLTASASGDVGDLEEIGPPVEVGPVVEYTPRQHPGRFCDDGGGIGVG